MMKKDIKDKGKRDKIDLMILILGNFDVCF